MAEIAAVKEVLSDFYGDQAHLVTWPLANGDSGVPLKMPGNNDRSVQVEGTFGAGGTLLIEGSNDGTNWRTLTDPQGNPLSFTTAKIEAITELTKFIRPRVSAGDGTTALVASMLVRRAFP